MQEPKKIRKLRGDLIKKLPKSPNNKATKTELEGKNFTELLIHYLNWACRYVAIKKRKVIIDPEVKKDRRWPISKPGIEALLKKVRKGEELTPHLSLRAHSKGYVSSQIKNAPSADRWEDKDFLLNVMGYHHFHLGLNLEHGGFVTRTDKVLFANVTRESFTAIAIFDHSVFEPHRGQVSSERSRLWKLFDSYALSGVSDATVVIPSLIATSGHPLHLVAMAKDYAFVISQTNPKLDQYEFLKGFYSDAGLDVPKKPKLEWWINFTDLGLFDKALGVYFVLRRGVT